MAVYVRYPHFVKDQRQFFDELVTEDSHTYVSPDWDYVCRYQIDRLFRRVRPTRILDVGCGCGFPHREMPDYPFVGEVGLSGSPAHWFGYLAGTGAPWIDRRCVETRTALGRWLPWAANGICMLFRRHGGS